MIAVKTLIGRLVLPLICVLLGWGVYAFGGIGQGDELRCGDRVMTTSDTCEHVTNGATRTNDYYQEKAENERLSNLVKNAGLGIMGLSGLSILYVLAGSGVQAVRKRAPAQP
ncbi:hypothetical protein GCM10023194_31110 [Planotetraspora phitsanulokensis]|uniref:Uncharacterized protein n=1 Tax=Planotetraspora phitsanulokensis TaxID=575192 RepID=A0A8J3XCK0_9ACTN|nr:hypothetical protein Pph01_07540 [Planotetraspora phitsanulokensis]